MEFARKILTTPEIKITINPTKINRVENTPIIFFVSSKDVMNLITPIILSWSLIGIAIDITALS